MEQAASSNETAPIIDSTPSEGSPEVKKEEYVIQTAFAVKKHLTEIYQRLNQLEAKIEKHIIETNKKTDSIDQTKLPVQEFREFVDFLNKTLIEALPNPISTADGSTLKAPSKNENIQVETATAQNKEPEQRQRNETTAASPCPPPSGSITHHRNFPLKTEGEIFYVGNGVTAVVGDAEIPPGTEVDEALVVKGNLKTGEACKFLKDIKALQNVEIGMNSTVEGNLVSGGKITIGPNCQVKGNIQGEIQEGAKENISVTS